jgi:hypothetical protein
MRVVTAQFDRNEAELTETTGHEMKSNGASSKCAFDLLIDDLAALMNRKGKYARPNHSAPAAGTMEVNGKLVKSISHGKPFALGKPAARKSVSKPRPVVARIDRKSAVAEIISKAFGMLNGGDLTAQQRGTLMLRLSELRDRVNATLPPLAKALSVADGDPRRAQRTVLRRLRELEEHLDGAAGDTHLARAAELVETATALLNSGSLSGGDHTSLAIALDDLRHRVERKSHAGR